jgi:hypothetical protein
MIKVRMFMAVAMFIALTGLAAANDSELVGVWRYQDANFSSEIIIQPGLRFQKNDSNRQHQSLISGPITLIKDPPTMRLNIRDYAPKQWCGPLGCKPIRMIAAETYRYQLNKQGLLLWTSTGKWQYRRMR